MSDPPAAEIGRSFRAGYAELWRLVTFKPVKSRHWRDYWLVWIPTMVIWAAILAVTGVAWFPWGLLLNAVVAFVVARAARSYWRRTRAT